MTPLQQSIAWATVVLEQAGVPSPRHDAEALAAHLLGLRRADLVLVDDLGPAYRLEFDELVARRARREPLQHITGLAPFRHLDLLVGPGVFVPRPETESVVQAGLDWLADQDLPSPLCVDLCSGSGAIALALATESDAAVHAVELSEPAITWARSNDPDRRVQWHLGDVADALHELDGLVDLVVSNPPYVPVEDGPLMEPEVLDHDPALALWGGGADGLDAVHTVARTAMRLLRPGGLVVCEHADSQGASAPAVFTEAGFVGVQDHLDLAGRPRFVTALRP